MPRHGQVFSKILFSYIYCWGGIRLGFLESFYVSWKDVLRKGRPIESQNSRLFPQM